MFRIGIDTTRDQSVLCISTRIASKDEETVMKLTKDLLINFSPCVLDVNGHSVVSSVVSPDYAVHSLKQLLTLVKEESEFRIYVCGSGSSQIESVFSQLSTIHALHIHKSKALEISIDAIDRICNVRPDLIFQYTSTSLGLMDLTPRPEHITYSMTELQINSNIYPYLLVNLRSGVSFHLVHSRESSERVGGSTIGGSTFSGLVNALFNETIKPFNVYNFATQGNQAAVDLLVGDIYGSNSDHHGLSSRLVASSLGKVKCRKEEIRSDLPDTFITLSSESNSRIEALYGICLTDVSKGLNRDVRLNKTQLAGQGVYPFPIRPESPNQLSTSNPPHMMDVISALLGAVSYNIAMLAYWNAISHNVFRIIMIGNYFQCPEYLASIQHSMSSMSNNTISLHFIKSAPFVTFSSYLFG